MSDPEAAHPAAAERPEKCVWCMADRQAFIGCCGRENPHHHTMTKWRGDIVRIIPSDDCPEALRGAAREERPSEENRPRVVLSVRLDAVL